MSEYNLKSHNRDDEFSVKMKNARYNTSYTLGYLAAKGCSEEVYGFVEESLEALLGAYVDRTIDEEKP